MSITKWYKITCNACGNADYYQGNLASVQEQWRKTGGITTKDKKHYCDEKCQPKKPKAETCENCGRDLPGIEICANCGHDNHKLHLSGRAYKKMNKQIQRERLERQPV